uniref:Doublecortin domain-containing protein n=1 Tax=Strongyloides stercoralis TaxID=6248 RepID=A0A0K0DWL8_STRER
MIHDWFLSVKHIAENATYNDLLSLPIEKKTTLKVSNDNNSVDSKYSLDTNKFKDTFIQKNTKSLEKKNNQSLNFKNNSNYSVEDIYPKNCTPTINTLKVFNSLNYGKKKFSNFATNNIKTSNGIDENSQVSPFKFVPIKILPNKKNCKDRRSTLQVLKEAIIKRPKNIIPICVKNHIVRGNELYYIVQYSNNIFVFVPFSKCLKSKKLVDLIFMYNNSKKFCKK